MKELAVKGVEELQRLKSRIARLYGMNRLSESDFKRLDEKVKDLEKDLRQVEEVTELID